MSRPLLVTALIAGAVLAFLAALASGFGEPIGPFTAALDAELSLLERVRLIGGGVNPVYLAIAAVAASAAEEVARLRAARWLFWLAVVQLVLVVYVLVFDTVDPDSPVAGLDTVYQVLFELGTLVVLGGVAWWSRSIRRSR